MQASFWTSSAPCIDGPGKRHETPLILCTYDGNAQDEMRDKETKRQCAQQTFGIPSDRQLQFVLFVSLSDICIAKALRRSACFFWQEMQIAVYGVRNCVVKLI